MTPRHIAVVAWGYPPCRASGVYRAIALANALADAGAAVTVITSGRAAFEIEYGADPNLEQLVDPAITVERVPFFPRGAWPLVNDWPRRRANQPLAVQIELNTQMPGFPERVYHPWLPRVHDALLAVHARRPLSAILATGNPYTGLEAASWAAADLDIPVVLDDRDSFLADVFTGSANEFFDDRLPYFRRWLRQARELWFVNPVIADWHRRRFPEAADRIHVVENGWDHGVIDALTPPPPRTPLTLGYVGLVPSNFPLDDVLTMWDLVRGEDVTELRFVGPLGYRNNSKFGKDVLQRLDDAPGARWLGHVTRRELAQVYRDIDVLLLIKEGGTMVTGSKSYEYGGTGLPIAGLTDPDSDANRVLAGHPRFHATGAIDPRAWAEAVRAAVADARSDADGARWRAAREFGAGLSRERELQPAIARLVQS